MFVLLKKNCLVSCILLSIIPCQKIRSLLAIHSIDVQSRLDIASLAVAEYNKPKI